MKLGPGGVRGQKNIFSNSFAFVLGSQKREFQEAKNIFSNFSTFVLRTQKIVLRSKGTFLATFQFSSSRTDKQILGGSIIIFGQFPTFVVKITKIRFVEFSNKSI